MWDQLKHAFAVNTPLEPVTRIEQELMDRLAREVVRRHMTTPALMFLEMSRPLNNLGAQAMHFFSPMVSAVIDSTQYEVFAKFLERRDALDLLAQRIEELEKLATTREQQQP